MDKLERIKTKVKEFRQRWYAINTDFAAGQKGALTDVIAFIDSMQEEPKPKFKVGDKVMPKRFADGEYGLYLDNPARIKDIVGGYYILEGNQAYRIEKQDHWELVREPSIPDIVDEHFMEMLDKEPVSKEIGDYDHKAVDEALHPEFKKEPVSNIDFEKELYKAFGQVKDFTLGMRIAKWFYDMGKNHQEPVSKGLEEASKNYALNNTPWDDCKDEIQESFKAGAKWQAELFEKNRLKHCNSITNEQAELEQGFIDQHIDKHQRMPTFLDAIENGMQLMKEQMMEKAIDARCFGFQGAALFSFRLPADNYLVGSEVKVIVIKK